jgi:conjugative transfer signal peptidase TraF
VAYPSGQRQVSRVLVVAALGAFLEAVPPLHPPLLVWNASASVPIGLYAIEHPTNLQVADLVIVRPPEQLESFLADRNYLPRGVPLVKHVSALAGQSVCRTGFAITIDAVAVANARESDSRGRPLPSWQGCRVVGEDEVFLLNPQSDDSLDGRYFSVLPTSSIVGRALPLWIPKPLGESRSCHFSAR